MNIHYHKWKLLKLKYIISFWEDSCHTEHDKLPKQMKQKLTKIESRK